jgi:YVTN family beta-propeller protein
MFEAREPLCARLSSCHASGMAELPRGAVTFLFTDIEGSTRLVKQLREQWGEVLSQHQELLRAAFLNHSGYEVDTQGDSFFVAFVGAREAVRAAVEGQRAILSHRWPHEAQVKVRMGIHTGQAVVSDGRYTGLAVHRAARVGAAGHGGQVLVSQATQTLLEDEEEDLDVSLRDLGEQRLKDLDRPVRLYQVEADGLPTKFPPLRHEAELAAAAETALAAHRPRLRRLVFVGAGLAVAAAAAIAVLLLSTGDDVVTVRPNSVGVIDPKSNRVVNQIPVGSRPSPITAGADAIWAANLDDRTLYRIDPRTLSTRQIALQGTPTDLAYGAKGVWVAYGLLGTVQRVDTEFKTAEDPIELGTSRAVGGSIAFGFGSVWFASANSVVTRLDPDSGKVIKTFYSGSSPSGIDVDNEAIWVANKASNDVHSFSPTGQPITTPYSVCSRPTAIATGGDAVWIACGDSNAVTRIDPLTRSTFTIPVGNRPSAIAYGSGAVWVANAGDGTVSRIDPTTYKVTKIAVGNDPEGIVVAENRVWVTVQAP